MHNPPTLKSVNQVQQDSEQTVGTKFESKAAAFIDAYENGEFHEHDTDSVFALTAMSMNDLTICEAVPTIIKPLVNHFQTEPSAIETLMDFHDQMVNWLNHRLEAAEDLFSAFANVRSLVERDMKETPQSKSWLADVMRILSLVHAAVLHRMGISTHITLNEYSHNLDKLL